MLLTSRTTAIRTATAATTTATMMSAAPETVHDYNTTTRAAPTTAQRTPRTHNKQQP